jgi:C4-dicarboxylate-specific signal transduction histidine kinase
VDRTHGLPSLLTNARDAFDGGFPGSGSPEKRLALRVQVVRVDDAESMRLTVGGNGLGIPAAIREAARAPFSAAEPRERGTGRGLPISCGVVRDHEGRLWIESVSPLRGMTAVHVDVPLSLGKSIGCSAAGGAR